MVIVGGGLGAVRTAEELRRQGYSGSLRILSAENHLPYDRPPLSKDMIQGKHPELELKSAAFYQENNIELSLGARAVGLDSEQKVVLLEDGTKVLYENLVIATGLKPRKIAGLPNLSGVYDIRSRDDAQAVLTALPGSRRALIVGAGFIGCEVAASLRTHAIEVTIIEPQEYPLASVLGPTVGSIIANLHRTHGVDVRTGVGLELLVGSSSVQAAQLTDGSRVEADLVVVGIGSIPVTDWLQGSGIALGNGVLCDNNGRTSIDNVWAIGDVAAWQNDIGSSTESHKRVEHWSNVAEQAQIMVPALLGCEGPSIADIVPYFWSDQYDVKIQALGRPEPDDVVHVIREDEGKFLAYFEREGKLEGVVGIGLPAQVMKMRAQIARNVDIEEVVGNLI
ncbi:MAG: NAD(P)/FAD-dependent oxidoreductase [Mycobacteriaceae bacterium]